MTGVGVNRPLLFGYDHKRADQSYNNPRNKSRSGGSNPGPSSSSVEFFVVDFDEPTALFAVDDPLGREDDPGAGSGLAGVGGRGSGAGGR